MCTAITFKNKDFYFGRNMDIGYNFGEKVVIVPRNYKLTFKHYKPLDSHYAMIGMAAVMDDYPLFAEAANEKGLCVAGLNFEGFAHYNSELSDEKHNITAYEVIPWILSQCATVIEAVDLLKDIHFVDTPFKENVPLSYLHFIISDKENCMVLEPTANGVKAYDNPVGVLTNNPTFDFHLMNLNNYLGLSARPLKNNMSFELDLKALSHGSGAIGLPGDTGSVSRFIRAVFGKYNSISKVDTLSSVGHYFHLLDSVAVISGTAITENGVVDYTTYSSCINTNQGIYYYKTYDNNQITGISLFAENLNHDELYTFELNRKQNIFFQNNKQQ